jgi:dTDP-4-amino-4,6-dideoxygalactose transaminase
MGVPFVDLQAQYQVIRDEVDAAMAAVVASGRFVGGPVVEAFESEFAAYCGVKHAVGVGNGTDALHLALRACGVGPGDEVITAALTFTATAEAIVAAGARPVFVDVDETYTLDVDQVAGQITAHTRAVVPVHLYGQPADMAPLMALAEQHGLTVIEDGAQAHGARYQGRCVGALGHMACFSFYPAKPLGAYGDGGAVLTNDDGWAQQVRVLADHGRTGYYEHQFVGINSRLDALQAAVLRIKLRHMDEWNAARRHVAATYDRLLASTGLALPRVAPGREHVYHLYVVRHPDREALRQRLHEAGIATGLHYPVPLHLQPAYGDRGYQPGSLPNSEAWAADVLSLPMYAELTAEQIAEVTASVAAALELTG